MTISEYESFLADLEKLGVDPKTDETLMLESSRYGQLSRGKYWVVCPYIINGISDGTYRLGLHPVSYAALPAWQSIKWHATIRDEASALQWVVLNTK